MVFYALRYPAAGGVLVSAPGLSATVIVSVGHDGKGEAPGPMEVLALELVNFQGQVGVLPQVSCGEVAGLFLQATQAQDQRLLVAMFGS